MIPGPAPRTALADLVAAEQGMAAVSDRRDAERKADLVKARRRIDVDPNAYRASAVAVRMEVSAFREECRAAWRIGR